MSETDCDHPPERAESVENRATQCHERRCGECGIVFRAVTFEEAEMVRAARAAGLA